MSFLFAEMLWALVLVPLAVICYLLLQRRRRRYALRYSSLSLMREAIGRGPGFRRHVPPIVFLCGLTFGLFALSRPQAAVLLPTQQGTVILTVDVSGSMRADDLKPSRLDAAKAAAVAFVQKQPRNVRIGVVSFSSMASVVQAPTIDREAVSAAIGRLAPQRATAIGSGILTSLDAVFEDQSPKPTPSARDSIVLPEPTAMPAALPPGNYVPALIVLLSDGQSNTGPDPLQVAKQASSRGVRVYTVGVGDPEGTVLRFQGRSMRVRLDEETLKGISTQTDGDYFRADNETDLRAIYERLGTQLVFKVEHTELTAAFSGLATLLGLVAAGLSLFWFGRLL